MYAVLIDHSGVSQPQYMKLPHFTRPAGVYRDSYRDSPNHSLFVAVDHAELLASLRQEFIDWYGKHYQFTKFGCETMAGEIAAHFCTAGNWKLEDIDDRNWDVIT